MFFLRILSATVLCVTLAYPGFSQPPLTEFDQVKISKTGQSEYIYTIDYPDVKKASFKFYPPKEEKKDISYLLDEFSKSLLPRFFENAYSHKDMYFRIPAEIKFDDKKVHWKVNIYAFGTQEKIRTKKQEFENKKILTIEKNVRLDWGLDTWCIFEERGKKMGGFSIKLNPFRDSQFLKTAYYSIEPGKDQSWVKLKHPFDSLREIATFKDPDYGAVGLFQNVPAVFLYYAEPKKLWIFINAEPVCYFRLESTHVEMFIENGRNRYVAHQDSPELWISREGEQEKKAQIIRLALCCRLMVWALNHTEFD